MGTDFVVAMCHHIEDPTFDATAAATNPRARMRPKHRPPRWPADRHPHCHWVVEIDPATDPLSDAEAVAPVAASRAAHVVLGPDAPPSYAGAFDPDFQLEHLPADALERALEEVCLQGHLLVHSFLLTVASRFGADAAREIGAKQLAGIGGVVAARLAVGDGIDAIAAVLDIHPAFRPRAYVNLQVARDGDELAVEIGACEGVDENGGWSWPALIDTDAVCAIVQGVDARARVRATGERTWTVSCPPDGERAKERAEVALTRFSTGADFKLER
jgi:hypothetical protein